MIRAIVFDLDGTLIPRGAVWLRCLEGFLLDHRDAAEDVPVATFHVLASQIVAQPDIDRRDVARILALSYPGLGMTQAQVLADLDQRLPRCIVPDPAVQRLLAGLADRYTTAILTNGSSRMQRAKLQSAGLVGAAGRVFISGDLGVRKPDPRSFEAVTRWAGVEPGEALMVGDD
ncbi:MAG: HAD family hydrolase, partial [Thermoleophilia bacterium]|nr:HAD family hydrolase [Mycobacteriaceae bacterium]MBY0398007.1 HAD family hydrolase [Thermoleophilia bacterium]